jgi:hypothetical protein
MVSAWPGPLFARPAGACDGVEAFALGGATTKRQTNSARNVLRRCGRFRAPLQKPVVHLFRRGDEIPADIAPHRAIEFAYDTNAAEKAILREARRVRYYTLGQWTLVQSMRRLLSSKIRSFSNNTSGR